MSIMDTTGFSQVGKYGTLSLMKRNEEAVITSFGIDTEELTFGRDPTCSVRLYYPDVSLVHCKIVFEERKAFLAILGEGGLVVDGCEVYPSTGGNAAPTMVPLTNNSEIVIRQKRFRFAYPPKDMRATLFNTPSPSRNRKLRLSMIHSAQVFTPRPSNDPRENLRTLQSPMKNKFKSPMKPSLLSRALQTAEDDEEEEEEEEEIVLVDGNHPRVVEEDRDLVILEDVPTQMPLARPTPNYPPKTPPRRKSRITLHRAVLIRSAQRAVIRAEEEEEEQEVLESVVAEHESDEDKYDEESDEDADAREENEDVEMEDVVSEPEQEPESSKPGWRKSLGRIWPFTGGTETKNGEEESRHTDDDDEMEEEEQDERKGDPRQDNDSDEYDDEDSENFDAGPAPLPAMPLQTPARRPLGTFLTPQIRQGDRPSPSPFGGRLSLGGGPRRERVEQPWRVKDIIVEQEPETSNQVAEPQAPVQDTPRRAAITEEERSAIRERRRSAVRQPDNFFPGGVPGLSPKKPTIPVSPIKPSIPLNPSPIKGTPNRRTSADDEELDTRSLLEKMKETVETMKRRKSLAPTGVMDATPQRLFPATPKASGSSADSRMSVKKLYLGEGPSNHSDNPFAPEEDEGPATVPSSDEPAAMDEDEPEERIEERSFSLLTPMARRELPALVRVTAATPVATPPRAGGPPMGVDEGAGSKGPGNDQEREDPMDEDPKEPQPSSRLLRPKKIVPTPSDDELLSVDPEPELTQSRRRSPRPRSQSPQPPSEQESEADVQEERTPVPKAASTRRTKATEALTSKTSATRPAQAEAPVPVRRGTRAASKEPIAAVEKPAPARRGRKPASVREDTQGEVDAEGSRPAPTATKRGGRKTPASQSTAGEESGEEGPAAPAPARKSRITRPAAVTAAAKKRAVQAAAAAREEEVDDDDDDDPLDALTDAPRAPLPSAKAKGKTKAAVKQEDDDSSTSSLSNTNKTSTVTKPAQRGGRTAGSTLKTPAPIATKARTTRKTPATAPSAVGGGRNKENSTPAASGSGGGSGSGPGPIGGAESEAIVKLKVSRSRGKVAAPTGAAAGSSGARSRSRVAATAVKEEPEEEPKTRATRSMRARTKTG